MYHRSYCSTFLFYLSCEVYDFKYYYSVSFPMPDLNSFFSALLDGSRFLLGRFTKITGKILIFNCGSLNALLTPISPSGEGKTVRKL